MSDDDLIRLAAKAAGIDTRKPWNGKTDDGDAMRLVVKLRMLVDIHPNYTEVMAGAHGRLFRAKAAHGADAGAATRSAIVDVAAQIGEAMP